MTASRRVLGVEQAVDPLPPGTAYGPELSPQASEPPGPVSYWGQSADMQTSTSREDTSTEPVDRELDRNHLKEVIDHAGHLLPAQGPITVFIHHNTLHAFEDLPFNAAVKKGGHIFGCQPYLSEDRYRQELLRGRIRFDELKEALRARPGRPRGREDPLLRHAAGAAAGHAPEPPADRADRGAGLVRRRGERPAAGPAGGLRRGPGTADRRDAAVGDPRPPRVRRAEPQRRVEARGRPPRIPDSLAELLFRFGESRMEYWSDADWEGLTLQALWRVCCDGVRDMPAFTTPAPLAVRHRDVLLEATGVDTDLLVNDRSDPASAPRSWIRGSPTGSCPGATRASTGAFCSLYRQPWGPPDRWMRGLAAELGRLQDEGIGPLESVLESLEILGVAAEEWERYLSATLLALRGWAGMVRQIEARGDRVVHPVPEGSLVEFLAIRLLLDRFARGLHGPELTSASRRPSGSSGAWHGDGSIRTGRPASSSGPSRSSSSPRSPACRPMSSTA